MEQKKAQHNFFDSTKGRRLAGGNVEPLDENSGEEFTLIRKDNLETDLLADQLNSTSLQSYGSRNR